MKKEKMVNIHCTKKQALLIEQMLEYGSRLGAGQLHHIIDIIDICHNKMRVTKFTTKEWREIVETVGALREDIDSELAFFKLGSVVENLIKPLVFPELARNESYGVGQTMPNGQIMYEIYKRLQNFRVKDQKDCGVLAHEPLHYSKEPLVTITEDK